MFCAEGGTVLREGMRSTTDLIPAWIWTSPARVPWGGGRKMPLSPSMGNVSREWAELLASEPCWVQAGPHHETWCSSLMKISFISALYQHNTAPALGG